MEYSTYLVLEEYCCPPIWMPTFQLLSPLAILLDLMACKKISDHFARSLDGSILATDGFDINHACYPCLSEVERRKDYQIHKDGFTVIALTCNDIDARIFCDSATHSGSENDKIAWQDSDLYRWVAVGKSCQKVFYR